MKKHQEVSGVLLSALICVLAVLFFAVATAPAAAEDSAKAQGLVDKSRITFDDFIADKEMVWLNEHVKDARGVIIVPQMLKGGFILGASGGSGVLVVRDEKTGEWTDPAFYNIGSLSLGLQIGASAAEVVMLVMSQRAVDALLTTSVKLGGDISAAIGPTGAGAAAKGIRADIISFARAKGAYIGVSLEGAVIDTADSMNSAYYGKAASPSDIFIRHEVRNPKAEELRNALIKASK
jgi:lipid-binding SYLF domain-containing protein